MCYSAASSLRTTAISLVAIIYLLSSNNDHFKWLAVTLFGWCAMQFAEFLLWLSEPHKGCTHFNTIITMTLIPFVLWLQPAGPLLGSLYVIPWAKSTTFRKYFLVLYSFFLAVCVASLHYYKPYKICTTVTPGGHLYWHTQNPAVQPWYGCAAYCVWLFLIALPLLLFWNKSFIILFMLSIIPLVGFSVGLFNSDSRASIWCYYTSYTSAIASFFLFLKQTNIYSVL